MIKTKAGELFNTAAARQVRATKDEDARPRNNQITVAWPGGERSVNGNSLTIGGYAFENMARAMEDEAGLVTIRFEGNEHGADRVDETVLPTAQFHTIMEGTYGYKDNRFHIIPEPYSITFTRAEALHGLTADRNLRQ